MSFKSITAKMARKDRVRQGKLSVKQPLPPRQKNLKIRYREVTTQKPFYGRYGEYQVVDGRKIIGRFDLREQALKIYPDATLDESAK